MDRDTISTFCSVFIDSFNSCLCFTQSRWPCDFLPKNPLSCIKLPYLLIELLYICMPVVRTDGWVDGQLYGQVKVTTNNCRNFTDSHICRYSDFVTNSYGVSLDSSCEKPWVPVKKKRVRNGKCLGLYVTRQLIWRQTPKLCITVYWN